MRYRLGSRLGRFDHACLFRGWCNWMAFLVSQARSAVNIEMQMLGILKTASVCGKPATTMLFHDVSRNVRRYFQHLVNNRQITRR